MRRKRPALVLTFASTSQAIAAEALFTQKGLPGRTIPVPAQVAAGCGLAWKAEPEDKQVLLEDVYKRQTITSSAAACLTTLSRPSR